MSSNDKRDLTTKNNSTKAGSATVIGDIVTLPPDSDDVIFTTICDDSISGTVDAELEMSYDKENWCPAVTEEFTTGATVVGWGNEKFLLTKVATEVKNKHAKGSLNFDTSGNEVESGGTRDVLFNFIQKDKPFNLSWWHKSEDQPSATYNPIIFRHGNKDPFTNNKHLNLLPKADSTPVEKKNKHLQAPANIGAPARDIFHEKMGANNPFTINKWFKSSTELATTATANFENTKALKAHYSNFFTSDNPWGTGMGPDQTWTFSYWYKHNTGNAVPYYWSAAGSKDQYDFSIIGASSSYFKIKIGDSAATYAGSVHTAIKDGDWHHIMITNDGTGSTTENTNTMGASDSQLKLYIDGTLQTITEVTDIENYTLDTGTTFRGGLSDTYYGPSGFYDNISFWTSDQSSNASTLYNSGTPTDLTGSSGLVSWFQCGDKSGDSSTASPWIQDSVGSSSLIPYEDDDTTQGWADSADGEIVTLTSSDGSAYIAPSNTYTDTYLPVLFNNGATDGSSFGNGLTASFTKKVVTVPWGNTKYYESHSGWGVWAKTSRILNENVATGSAPLIRYDRDWTISFWTKDIGTSVSSWGMMGTRDRHSDSSGTGWENEFGMALSNTYLYFDFTDSSGSVVAKRLYYNGAMDGGFEDGDWHFVTVTFNANGQTSGDFEFQPSNALHSNTSSPDSQRSMTVYIDGQVFNNDASPPGGAYHNYLGTVSDCEITSGNKEWYWVERHSHAYYTPNGKWNQFAVYNEYMTASQVADLYDGTAGTKGGDPVNVSALSSCKVALEFNDDTYANTDTTQFEFTNSAFSGAWASDPYPSKRDTTNAGASIQDFSASDDTYVAMTVANTFDATASQGTSFLLSLDGFESGADAWVSYPVGSLLDGNWHNMQITYTPPGSFSEGDNITYGDSTEGNNNLKVYVDGEWVASNASKGGSSTFAGYDKHFKWTTGTFVPGTFGASGWKETSSSTDYNYAFQGAFDQLSLHSEATDLTKAQEFYGKGTIYEGQPHNYQMSDSLTYANVEGWWTFDEGGDSTTVANDKTSNNIDLTLNYFASDGNNLTSNSGQSIYIAPIGRAVGEGFTVSMTKNLKDDGSWVTTNDQTTRLVLSFNGIESEADHFVAYNVNQTGLSKPTNLLDGLWHNVVISFQGTTDNSGTTYLDANEIRFGPVTQGSVIQNYHISVSFDGQTLENLVPGGSADQIDDGTGSALSGITGWDVSKKLASGKMEAGFVIEQKDLRHTNSLGTYVPTTYLASGLMEDSGDGKYAFQGGFDDSSFHSDNWWVTADGTLDPNAYNKEKAKTIYGNTGGLDTAQQTRRAPYDLRDPASIEATATSNQYINPNPYSSANTTGGMEVYYRWGDTFGDCSESIRDVKSHESSPASTKRDLSAEGTMTHATVLDTDASESTDFTKDLTYDNSGTYKMYVEKTTSTTPGGLSVKNVKISGCGADKCQQQGVLAPKLQHMRVKWSGSGSCDLGDDKCRAQLWFRRRKK